MVFKVGDELYHVWVELDPYEHHESMLQTWVITTIRSGVAYLVWKSKWTWVKKSSKTGDYGWADHIDRYNRDKFNIADGLPKDYSRTKVAAYRKAITEANEYIAKAKQFKARLKAQITKLEKKK